MYQMRNDWEQNSSMNVSDAHSASYDVCCILWDKCNLVVTLLSVDSSAERNEWYNTYKMRNMTHFAIFQLPAVWRETIWVKSNCTS